MLHRDFMVHAFNTRQNIRGSRQINMISKLLIGYLHISFPEKAASVLGRGTNKDREREEKNVVSYLSLAFTSPAAPIYQSRALVARLRLGERVQEPALT